MIRCGCLGHSMPSSLATHVPRGCRTRTPAHHQANGGSRLGPKHSRLCLSGPAHLASVLVRNTRGIPPAVPGRPRAAPIWLLPGPEERRDWRCNPLWQPDVLLPTAGQSLPLSRSMNAPVGTVVRTSPLNYAAMRGLSDGASELPIHIPGFYSRLSTD